LLEDGVDINSRNCLGCIPLMYAAGSGQVEVVRLLLAHPATCLNIRGNDRLTTFMLAMQAGREPGGGGSAQEQLKKMMDIPATSETDWVRNDKWTVLMEAASFGQAEVVSVLLERPGLELEAVNVRGQTAMEVAQARGHLQVSELIKSSLEQRDKPDEVARIQVMETQVEEMKIEARRKLIEQVDRGYARLEMLKEGHEAEMEPLTRDIDRLQALLDEAMKKRLGMITRQVAQVHRMEEELQVTKRQLDTFDRLYGMGGPASPTVPRNSILEKDFECPVCYEVMSPPSRIFQCSNGHLICEQCKQRQEIRSCPTCRVPLGPSSLLRNIPLEKLAKTYFERCPKSPISSSHLFAPAFALEAASRGSSRRSSVSRQQTISQGSPSWPHDDMDSRLHIRKRILSAFNRCVQDF